MNLPVTFNPQLPNYSKIIKQHWQYMVEQHPDLKNIFSAPPRVCYRRPKNLRDILVKAQVPKPSTTVNLRTQKGFKRFGATRCMSCIHSVNKTHHKKVSKDVEQRGVCHVSIVSTRHITSLVTLGSPGRYIHQSHVTQGMLYTLLPVQRKEEGININVGQRVSMLV